MTKEKENEYVDYDLVFLTPWKSKAKVRFELKEEEGGTHVSWFMDSSLPFFMFWMKKSMTAFIGMDYDRGLNLLKDMVEDGKVHSKLNFKGIQSFPGYTYVGITTTCSMPDIGSKMSADLQQLSSFFESHEAEISGVPFSQYHKWDMGRGLVKYTTGIPVKNVPELPDHLNSGTIPSGKVYTVEHVGPYRHLGNAWTTMHNMMRQKEFKAVKGIHPFESYINSPHAVDEKNLITTVNFMVKE